ncbi:MAG: hypothetical protein M3256_05535 [Actinomycetota bacterium]|nr:hypothetical protein [Actinomycetota bacterium]
MPLNESEPLWDPERHRERVVSRGRRLRRRHERGKTLGVGGGVVVLIATVALVWPHSTNRVAVVAGPAPAASTGSAANGVNSGAAAPESSSPPPNEPTAPDDGRLHRSYIPVGYRPGDSSLSSYRVDPAPEDLKPALSQADAVRAFEVTDAASVAHQAGTTVIVRFGLFTGSVLNPPAPDHTLTGTHQVQQQPAWLILIDGVRSFPSRGGAANPPEILGVSPAGATAAATTITTAPGPEIVTGHAVAVITDPEGRLLTGLTITGGSVAELGVS